MAKVLFVCSRSSDHPASETESLTRLALRLTPDNVSYGAPTVLQGRGIVAAIMNQSPAVRIHDTSVCVGALLGDAAHWWRPGQEAPDGSYGLIRSDDRTVELVSDAVASRTIWYVQTEDRLVASTSQRAIAYVLKSFQPNRAAVSWMLSSGCLGPDHAWDRRVTSVPPGARVILDRGAWTLRVVREETVFEDTGLSEREYGSQLRDALRAVFADLHIEIGQWRLLLSGGHDSRAMLLELLARQQRPRCFSYGKLQALADERSDPAVAKRVAEHYGLEHEFFARTVSEEPLEVVMDRFLVAGEGRIEHIAGYIDGFATWKHLFDAGCAGVLRGDQEFGWLPVYDAAGIRHAVGADMADDLDNLKGREDFDLEQQEWPARLCRREGESLAAWRDRLNHDFRLPVVLAALNDLKCSYVEVVNPLLSRRLTSLVRSMPDRLRTDKRLFRQVVDAAGPPIPYAIGPGVAAYGEDLNRGRFVEILLDTLRTGAATSLLSDSLRGYIAEQARQETNAGAKRLGRRSIRRRLQAWLPPRLDAALRQRLADKRVGGTLLAWRASIACRMVDLLAQDARAGTS